MRITRTIIELRERFQLLSREVIVPFHVDLGENIKSRFLNWRQKSKFDLCSCKFYRIAAKQLQIVDPDRHTKRIMAQMQKTCVCP
jgi:excinuclease ABC subunit C